MTVGVDVTSVERIRALLSRYPDGEQRFFTDSERRHCNGFPDPMIHFAGTFAAKEAVLKAAHLGPVAAWARRIEIARDPSGAPRASIRGVHRNELTVSISHDGDVAVAIAICAPQRGLATPQQARVGSLDRPADAIDSAHGVIPGPVLNPNLRRFLGMRVGSQHQGGPERLGVLTECSPGSDFP